MFWNKSSLRFQLAIHNLRFTIRFQLFTNHFFRETKKIANQRKRLILKEKNSFSLLKTNYSFVIQYYFIYIYICLCVCIYIHKGRSPFREWELHDFSCCTRPHVFTSIRILIECSAVELHKIDEKDVMENSYGMF